MREQELWKKVPIYFYYLSISKHKDAKDDSAYSTDQIIIAFSQLLEYIMTKGLPERKKDITSSEKVVWLDSYEDLKNGNYDVIFKSAKYSADTAELNFDLRGRKLECKGEPRGFIAKCADGQWRDAKAEFSGGKLTVKTPDGSAIKGVRYLWKGWAKPDVCLYNDAGIPAFGFTDEIR